MPKQYNLEDLELDEVSFVDVPANQASHVVLVKHAGDKPRAEVRLAVSYSEAGTPEVIGAVFKGGEWTPSKASEWLQKRNLNLFHKESMQFRAKPNFASLSIRTFAIGAQMAKALEAGASWNRLEAAICAAIDERFGSRMPYDEKGVFVRDIWEDVVVFETYPDREMFRISYTATVNPEDKEITVELGTPVPVRLVYVDSRAADESQPDTGMSFDQKQRVFRLANNVRRLSARLNQSCLPNPK